jgi:hypothetical protein
VYCLVSVVTICLRSKLTRVESQEIIDSYLFQGKNFVEVCSESNNLIFKICQRFFIINILCCCALCFDILKKYGELESIKPLRRLSNSISVRSGEEVISFKINSLE